jgi:23S rRNA (pseudouridine1915-N3)-methyltransferase
MPPLFVIFFTGLSLKSSAFLRTIFTGCGDGGMEIDLICVGRVREEHLAKLCDDYRQRIVRYGHRLEVVEVKEEPGSRPDDHVIARESERLAAKIPAGAWTVAMDLKGEMLPSRKFAAKLSSLADSGVRRISFIIGGALGLSDELVNSCRQRLSLSRMTLTHEMARMVLLEQLYRANTILRGEPYHK